MILPPGSKHGGWTMAELMIVIAIMGVVLAAGVPTVFSALRKSPIRQAVSDLQEACRAARMMAIVTGRPADLVITAQDGALTVRPAPAESEGPGQPLAHAVDAATADGEVARAEQVLGFSAHLPDSVAFKKLVVNLRDMMEYDEARVRFYPNGTCDALVATLLSEQNEERTITLEITTGRDHLEVVR